MQTIIGCVEKSKASQPFSSPECEGAQFRKTVDIYACGDSMWLAKILPGYATKLKQERDGGDCLVIARSFIPGGGPGGRPGGGHGRGHGGPDHGCPPPPPPEMFDIAYCVPIEAMTDDLIDNFEDMIMHSGGGRGGRR